MLSGNSFIWNRSPLCFLKRVAYPCRYSNMMWRFGRPVPVLSMVSNHVLDYIFNLHSHRILNWNQNLLSPAKLQVYSYSIVAKGAALQNCFGFIDGTLRPISRSGELQRIVDNGHKRVHALKFHSVALPNGLIGNLFGPLGKSEIEFFIQMYFALIYSFIYIFQFSQKAESTILECLQTLVFSMIFRGLHIHQVVTQCVCAATWHTH